MTTKNIRSKKKGPEVVRNRPAVIFGASDAEGCKQMIIELITYFIQDFLCGDTGVITISKLPDNSYVIEANGEGLFDRIDIGTDFPKWENIFGYEGYIAELFDAYSSRRENLSSITKCGSDFPQGSLFPTTAASQYMNVCTTKNGVGYTLLFNKGELEKSELMQHCSSAINGTKLYFSPDSEVFSSTDFDFSSIFEYAAQQAAFSPGLVINVRDWSVAQKQEKSFYYEDGFAGMLADELGLISCKDTVRRLCWECVAKEEYKPQIPYNVIFEIALAKSSVKPIRGYFHNYRHLEHGGILRFAVSDSIEEVRTMFNEVKTEIDEILNHISIYVATISEYTVWSNGRHDAIQNSGIYGHLKSKLVALLIDYIRPFSGEFCIK